ADLGFEFKAGGNQINMLKIIDGQYCGACHNGEIAWSAENCNLCHSGKPGTLTQVHESTLQKLGAPAGPPAAAASPVISGASAPARK
ncbi:MAG: cytochrome c3 family protein, partial [Piscinibacter sp.]|uniref:cytochrome c3 family protein n=1 Tax=Piscinibacter sp. TaxID=1903157 RepID=UPI003D0EF99E